MNVNDLFSRWQQRTNIFFNFFSSFASIILVMNWSIFIWVLILEMTLLFLYYSILRLHILHSFVNIRDCCFDFHSISILETTAKNKTIYENSFLKNNNSISRSIIVFLKIAFATKIISLIWNKTFFARNIFHLCANCQFFLLFSK